LLRASQKPLIHHLLHYQLPSPISNSGSVDYGGLSFFSIEPGADLDKVMSLLNANYILHICILYLPIDLMILYVSTMTMVFENK
jgi:hypothetical protein